MGGLQEIVVCRPRPTMGQVYRPKNMRIGIDCRMAGTGEGIGRYVEELVVHLAKLDKLNQYYLLRDKISNSQFLISKQISNLNFQFVKVSSPYYSLAEQTKFIRELRRLKLDLVHFASFNVPIFYPGKFVVTIHDLIHHLFPGKKKSRLIHRLAYKAVINAAVKRAATIIAVSEATKTDILQTFKVNPQKIQVIYEGADEKFFQRVSPQQLSQIKTKYQLEKPYLLWVGVWRQYKNLSRLALAFDIIKEKYSFSGQLVLAGKTDPYYLEIKQAIESARFAPDIKALGFVPEEDLRALYQGAAAFVLPSLVEGFGLIGAEAQAAGIPVAASQIPVLREVLGGGAVYFDPENVEDMAAKIDLVLTDEELRTKLIREGLINASRFDWQNTARQTLEIYKQADKLVLGYDRGSARYSL